MEVKYSCLELSLCLTLMSAFLDFMSVISCILNLIFINLICYNVLFTLIFLHCKMLICKVHFSILSFVDTRLHVAYKIPSFNWCSQTPLHLLSPAHKIFIHHNTPTYCTYNLLEHAVKCFFLEIFQHRPLKLKYAHFKTF